MSHFALFLAAMTACFTFSGSQMAAAQDSIQVHDAYARVSGDTAKSGAIFMTLINPSPQGDRLLSVASDAADRAELHSHAVDANGVMHMGEVTEGFAVPAGDAHALDRAGDHIMLLGLKHPLKQGDTVTLTLTFEHAGPLTVTVPVDNARKPAAQDAMGVMQHTDQAPATTD
jgi:periplasmic copper chaperone A